MFSTSVQNHSFLLIRIIIVFAMLVASLPVFAAAYCKAEPGTHSHNSDVATEIRFVNASRSQVEIYWLDFTGKRVFYNRLAAGEHYVQQTYLTHPWVAINAHGDCLGLYMPAANMRTIYFK